MPWTCRLTTVLLLLLPFALPPPNGRHRFGHIRDVYGRRLTMLISILTITIPTVLIGCLPTYHQEGIAAPVLLTIMRFTQGRNSNRQQLQWLMCHQQHQSFECITLSTVHNYSSKVCLAGVSSVRAHTGHCCEASHLGVTMGLPGAGHSMVSDAAVMASLPVGFTMRVPSMAKSGLEHRHHSVPLLHPPPSQQPRSCSQCVRRHKVEGCAGRLPTMTCRHKYNSCVVAMHRTEALFPKIFCHYAAGLAVGGEFGGCIVYLYEIAPQNRKGLLAAFGQQAIVSATRAHFRVGGLSS